MADAETSLPEAPDAAVESDAATPAQEDAAAGDAAPGSTTADEAEPGDGATIPARGIAEDVEVPSGSVLALAFMRDDGLVFQDIVPASSGVGDFDLTLQGAPPTRAQLDAHVTWLAGEGRLAVARLAILPADHAAELIVGEGGVENDDTPGPYVALSEGVIVVWSDQGLAESSVFSHLLGLREDLAPGYALIALGENRRNKEDPDAQCAGGECAELYEAEALAQFNAAHGTSYNLDDGVPEGPEQDAQNAEILERALQLAIDHGVEIAQHLGTRVVRAGESRRDVHFVTDPSDLY